MSDEAVCAAHAKQVGSCALPRCASDCFRLMRRAGPRSQRPEIRCAQSHRGLPRRPPRRVRPSHARGTSGPAPSAAEVFGPTDVPSVRSVHGR